MEGGATGRLRYNGTRSKTKNTPHPFMSQHTDILLPQQVYTRTDYTALRAWCLKIPLAKIADLYYSDDSPQIMDGLETFLLTMRNHLIEGSILRNPALAAMLQNARQGGAVTTAVLKILIEAADIPPAQPAPHQPVAQWLRPRTAAALKQEGIHTLGELRQRIHQRGDGWWRPIPRIGALRAKVILAWLASHQKTLGELALSKYTAAAPAPARVLRHGATDTLAPLGRFSVPSALDGTNGVNRSGRFCFIQASNDLQAVEFYLSRFDDQPQTFRAYRKELERFLLWGILIAGKPLSSMLVNDCEAYKRFLQMPCPEFCGERTARFSHRWRPFSTEPLSPPSQKQAVLILRAAFDWLVRVRYLGGNPWVAVKDPSVVTEIHAINIESALSDTLWGRVAQSLDRLCAGDDSKQDRAARAVILLLGDSGLRRAEAAGAMRADLKPGRWAGVWVLRVVGKRNKQRDVPVSPRTVEALRAHWHDRGLDFDQHQNQPLPLIAPVTLPKTATALKRHGDGGDASSNGYSTEGLYRLVLAALKRIRAELVREDHDHDDGGGPQAWDDMAQLGQTTPHAFRHTFGTLAVADGMPLDVVQGILGHASAATTAIYVRAKEKRSQEAAEKYYAAKPVNQKR